MTSLLNALNSFSFTAAEPRTTREPSDVEFQSVLAATALLLAGGIAATLVALAQI
jgi:hypothetical protein